MFFGDHPQTPRLQEGDTPYPHLPPSPLRGSITIVDGKFAPPFSKLLLRACDAKFEQPRLTNKHQCPKLT
ncbi:hypothetical protein DPMN_141430 [Dreissena polymorpha]|uniref:Uncharacterized protein n=1 Tax=Dreissena polymorpha TaxID=45954 RepID=A0A9D4GDF8_DREPO|nr:hypothetical protein DPMN_141430 [Dreissena polymorpha]